MRDTPRHHGFTLVELTAVVAISGILAAFAVPRLVGRTEFESRGFYDGAQSVVRYAQKLAVARRQSSPKSPIYVVIESAAIRICLDAACSSPLTDPTTGSALALSAPSGITLSPATTFSFDGAGTPSSASRLTVNVLSSAGGDVNRAFYVEAQTGYVHD